MRVGGGKKSQREKNIVMEPKTFGIYPFHARMKNPVTENRKFNFGEGKRYRQFSFTVPKCF